MHTSRGPPPLPPLLRHLFRNERLEYIDSRAPAALRAAMDSHCLVKSCKDSIVMIRLRHVAMMRASRVVFASRPVAKRNDCAVNATGRVRSQPPQTGYATCVQATVDLLVGVAHKLPVIICSVSQPYGGSRIMNSTAHHRRSLCAQPPRYRLLCGLTLNVSLVLGHRGRAQMFRHAREVAEACRRDRRHARCRGGPSQGVRMDITGY